MPSNKGLSMAQAKQAVIDAVAKGATVTAAVEATGRSRKSVENWRAADKEFAAALDNAKLVAKSQSKRGIEPANRNLSFAEFRKEYLGYDTYRHQQQWVDVLEGREPTPIEGCEWDQRNPKRLIVNVPPGHSKSSCLTVDWTTYKICMNPNVRICIISKKREMAQKFLHQVKQRLTSNLFSKLQAAYAPEGGFRPERGRGTFSANTIYVAGRDADIKDPTVEVLGIGSAIYGGRYDVIILDDAIDGTNAGEFEKQILWLEGEVESRVKNGTILVIGTRLRSVDLYSELRRDDRYMSGRSPWSYLRQPMVLRFADDPKDWVTLWPKSTSPFDEGDTVPDENGDYVMWDGPTCARVRDSKPPGTWSLVYQQQQISEDAIFNPVAVMGSVNRMRKPGPLHAGAPGHPRNGMEGMYIIGSVDPATSGQAFILVTAVDRNQNKRFVLNAFVASKTPLQWYIDQMQTLTAQYGVQEWVIEKNYAGWLIEDPRLTSWAAGAGVRITPTYTSGNKGDIEIGVMSMSGLFGTTRTAAADGNGRTIHNGDNLIELPDPDKSEGVKALIEQLIQWEPGKLGRQLVQDGVMAAWFMDQRARVICRMFSDGKQSNFARNSFLSRRGAGRRTVVPAEAYRQFEYETYAT